MLPLRQVVVLAVSELPAADQHALFSRDAMSETALFFHHSPFSRSRSPLSLPVQVTTTAEQTGESLNSLKRTLREMLADFPKGLKLASLQTSYSNRCDAALDDVRLLHSLPLSRPSLPSSTRRSMPAAAAAGEDDDRGVTWESRGSRRRWGSRGWSSC